jgi:hypothetical protein
MRSYALALVLVSGCSLYFTPHGEDDGPIADARPAPPDGLPIFDGGALPDAYGFPDARAGDTMARCEDGQLYAVSFDRNFPTTPVHGAGRVIGTCPGACQSAAVFCARSDCSDAAQSLCTAPTSHGATCSLDGARCQGASTIACPASTTCDSAVAGSTCACTDGAYRCTPLTPAAATQAALVGKWRGTVTIPDFGLTYPLTLWIYPDGSYWPQAEGPSQTAFYYGGDGGSPRRKLTVLSTSDTAGSWANIAIDFGYSPPLTGAISALSVDATTLRFTYAPSWDTCARLFYYTLRRY